jgi:hypothetical protein
MDMVSPLHRSSPKLRVWYGIRAGRGVAATPNRSGRGGGKCRVCALIASPRAHAHCPVSSGGPPRSISVAGRRRHLAVGAYAVRLHWGAGEGARTHSATRQKVHRPGALGPSSDVQKSGLLSSDTGAAWRSFAACRQEGNCTLRHANGRSGSCVGDALMRDATFGGVRRSAATRAEDTRGRGRGAARTQAGGTRLSVGRQRAGIVCIQPGEAQLLVDVTAHLARRQRAAHIHADNNRTAPPHRWQSARGDRTPAGSAWRRTSGILGVASRRPPPRRCCVVDAGGSTHGSTQRPRPVRASAARCHEWGVGRGGCAAHASRWPASITSGGTTIG